MGKKSAKVDGPPAVVVSSSKFVKKGKKKAEDVLKKVVHVKRQRRAAWKKKIEKKWKQAAQKKKIETKNPPDSESDYSASDVNGDYVCEIDTDGIDSSDDEHLKSRIAAKTMSIGNFSFNIEKAEILFKNAGEVVEVRFPTNEVAVFRGFGHVNFPAVASKKKADPSYVPADPESDYSGSDVNEDCVCEIDSDGISSSDDEHLRMRQLK